MALYKRLQIVTKIALLLLPCLISSVKAELPHLPSNLPIGVNDTNKNIEAKLMSPVKDNTSTKMEDAGQVWNLKDTSMLTLIHQIAQQTGKNFIVDPSVRGNVTFVSSHPLSKDEMYQAFLAILHVYGYTAMASDDDMVKIVPQSSIKQVGLPSLQKDGQPLEEIALRVIRIENTAASEVVRAIKPLVSQFAYLEAYQPTNDIIVSDYATNISKLVQIIDKLNRSATEEPDILHLQYAIADDIVKTLEPLVKAKSAGFPGGNSLVMNADDRTNSIIIVGGGKKDRAQLRSLALKLDSPTRMMSEATQVIYLKHLRAENAAPIIASLLQNFVKQQARTQGNIGLELQQPNSPLQLLKPSGSSSSSPSVADDLMNSLKQSSTSSSSSLKGAQVPYGLGSNASRSNTLGQTNDDGIDDDSPKSGSVGSAVQWEGTTNTVIVTASPAVISQIRKVISQIDIRRPQVLIEVIIAELDIDRSREVGVDWNTRGDGLFHTHFTPTLALSTVAASATNVTRPLTETLGDGLSLGFFRKGDLRVLLKALSTDSHSNILATPNIVTLDNEKAQIKVGKKVSFAIAQANNEVTTGGNPFTSFDRQDVGLILNIRPQITPSGSVKLEIAQDLSSIDASAPVRAGGNPDTTERYINTTIIVNQGETLVLGGLIQTQIQGTISKIPLLGDIPGIGVLFREHNKTKSRTNLMIFMRPIVLKDNDDDREVSTQKYDFMRSTQLQAVDKTPITEANAVLPPKPGVVLTDLQEPFEEKY